MSFSAVAGPSVMALKQTKTFRDKLEKPLWAVVTMGSLPVQARETDCKGARELGSGLKHVELKEKSRTTVEPPTLKTPIQSRSAPSLLPLEVRRVMRAIVRPPWQPNAFWGVLDIESTQLLISA